MDIYAIPDERMQRRELAKRPRDANSPTIEQQLIRSSENNYEYFIRQIREDRKYR